MLLNTEKRFCDKCMNITIHQVEEAEDIIYTYKRNRLYICKSCGSKSYRKPLRPSAESVY